MTLVESKFKLDDPPMQIYNQQKYDYIRVALNPGTSSRLNTGGDLVFEVDNQQSYLYMPDSFIHCEFTLCSDDKLTTRLPAADNITLENSFLPNLFSQVRLEVGSQTVESIANSPGVVDSLLRFVTKDPINVKNEGWIQDTNSGKYVSILQLKKVLLLIQQILLNQNIMQLLKDYTWQQKFGYTGRKDFYNKNNSKQSC